MPYYITNGVNNTQPLQGIAFGQPVNVNYFINKKSESDSYMGKTLLTVAAITGGLVFHKNIANVIKKFAPGIFNFFGKHVGSPAREFVAKYAKNSIVKTAIQGKHEFADIGDKIMNWIKAK